MLTWSIYLSRLRCKIDNKCLGIFRNADDLTLLCPTLSGLQEMLNVCEDFAKDYNILLLCFHKIECICPITDITPIYINV